MTSKNTPSGAQSLKIQASLAAMRAPAISKETVPVGCIRYTTQLQKVLICLVGVVSARVLSYEASVISHVDTNVMWADIEITQVGYGKTMSSESLRSLAHFCLRCNA